jgi:ribosome-binding protein aMBF1 (putative translation factor)
MAKAKAKGKKVEHVRTKAEREQMSNVAIYEEIKYLQSLVVIRKRKGLTVEMLATRMGVSEQYVRMFETPGYDPTLSALRRYALAIGADVKSTVRPVDPEPPLPRDPDPRFPLAG